MRGEGDGGKGALRKELKCNNSCCGHAQSALYAAFVAASATRGCCCCFRLPLPVPIPLSAFGRCAFVKLLLSAGVAVVGLTLQYERFGCCCCCCFGTVSGCHNDAHFLPKDLRGAVQAAY